MLYSRRRAGISAHFAWVAYSSLYWAGSEMPKLKGGLQACLLSSLMGRVAAALSQPLLCPGLDLSRCSNAGPTPAKHSHTCLTFNTSITHGEVKPREAAGAEIAVKRKWGCGDLSASLSQWTCLQTSFRAWGKTIAEAKRSMTCSSVLRPAPTFAKERGRE